MADIYLMEGVIWCRTHHKAQIIQFDTSWSEIPSECPGICKEDNMDLPEGHVRIGYRQGVPCHMEISLR